MLGAADGSECAVPPTVAPFNATLFNAAGSCAVALTLFNSLYNATLTTAQQVSGRDCWLILCRHGWHSRCARLACTLLVGVGMHAQHADRPAALSSSPLGLRLGS